MVYAPSSSAQGGGRARYLKQLLRWHWISSALALAGMLMFSITGITLNHAAQIEARPTTTHHTARLPVALLRELQDTVAQRKHKNTPPARLIEWAASQWQVDVRGNRAEWSDDELYIALPRAGGDAWLRVGLVDGVVEYEQTERGWVSWFNDLHKGRNTGPVWAWFIDLFAVICIMFCVTGLLILQIHAANRPLVWPVLGLGILIPVLLTLLFLHGAT
jgi:hypothetical protein